MDNAKRMISEEHSIFDQSAIVPVILCGGAGTRLWPVSRKSHPKQFSKLIDEKSLFQSVAPICTGSEFEAPLGSVHRLENPRKVPVVLIEVQTGSYLGEDDIIRYEDVYARK